MQRNLVKRAAKAAETIWPLLLSLCVCGLFCLVTAIMVLEMRSNAMRQAEHSANNLVNAIVQDVSHNFGLIGLSLDAIVTGLAREDIRALSPEVRQLVLFDRGTSAKNIGALVVFDEKGELQIDSASLTPRKIASVTDRDYFQAQIEKDSLFISTPYLSRLLGTDVVGLSRRITGPDGSFKGVALGTVKLSYFNDFFKRLNAGRRGIVSLVRGDGDLLVRVPPSGPGDFRSLAAAPTFQQMVRNAETRFIARSGIDGEERLYTTKHVEGFPLIVSVGLSIADIYAEWQTKALALALIVFAVCVVTVGLTWVLVRELRRRNNAEELLRTANVDLARMSLTDPLTGIANRRRFDEVLAGETSRAMRTGRQLSLLIIDADYFKRFNDHYGHQAGDEALRTIAACIKEAVRRPGDLACRIGGEEFAMILPDTDLSGAKAVAERARATVLRSAMPHALNDPAVVTVSVGVASLRGDEGAARLFKRTDAALYESKRTGRNRVTADERIVALSGRAA